MNLSDGSGETGLPAPEYNLKAVLLYGQLKKLSLKRLAETLARRDGRLTRSRRKASLTVLAHSSAASLLSSSGELALLDLSGPVVSERQFMQLLDLTRPAASAGPYRLEDVARAAGLAVALCRSLALFDLLWPLGNRYGYQDLATARQVARLLAAGQRLASIVDAGTVLAEHGLRLAQVRLVEAPWGLGQEIGGKLARLDGQLALTLDHEAADAAECFAQAETAEHGGDLAEAERWYAKAERIDRNDPVLPFNRGNVLAKAGRLRDAQLAFRQALARDPSFAEAAFNLARSYEAEGESDGALRSYDLALAAHAAYPEAVFNRARLLTELGRYPEALPLWHTFVQAWPDDPDIGHARRLALLCRLQAQARP